MMGFWWGFDLLNTDCLETWHQIRKCLRHCLRFAYARAGFAFAHIFSYVELTLAYAHHSFAYATTLQGAPCLTRTQGFKVGVWGHRLLWVLHLSPQVQDFSESLHRNPQVNHNSTVNLPSGKSQWLQHVLAFASVNLAFAELSPCFHKLGLAFAILQLKLLKPAFCSLQVNPNGPAQIFRGDHAWIHQNLRPKGGGWRKAKLHMSLETWWDLMGFWSAEYRLPRDLAIFEPVTIFFQHRFKIVWDVWGGKGGRFGSEKSLCSPWSSKMFCPTVFFCLKTHCWSFPKHWSLNRIISCKWLTELQQSIPFSFQSPTTSKTLQITEPDRDGAPNFP